jgi:hypothetical protein
MNDDEIRELEQLRQEKLRKIQETDTSHPDLTSETKTNQTWRTSVTTSAESLSGLNTPPSLPESAFTTDPNTLTPSIGLKSTSEDYTPNLSTNWQNTVLSMLNQGGGLDHAANEVEAWAKRFYYNERKGSMIILSGDSGTGKTMMSRNLRKWVDRVSPDCRFASVVWVDWVGWWERYQENKPCQDVQDMIEADCLFIDDVGAESDRYKSGQNTAILCQILGKREKKYTVITTNIPRSDFQTHFDTRVADRLKRNGAVYVSFWGIKSFNG